MFDVAPTELLVVALVALVVIGPKDLPRVMRTVGQWVSQMRSLARHFRSGFDEMVRQADIEDLERKWAEENDRIMREYPMIEPPAEADAGEAPAVAPESLQPAAEAPPPAPDGVSSADPPSSSDLPPPPTPVEDVREAELPFPDRPA